MSTSRQALTPSRSGLGPRLGVPTLPAAWGGQDPGLERRLLAFAQPLRAARARAVVQTFRSFRIVAQHGIAQRLPLHTGQPCSVGPGHPLQRPPVKPEGRLWRSPTGASRPGGPARSGRDGEAHPATDPGEWREQAWRWSSSRQNATALPHPQLTGSNFVERVSDASQIPARSST
jgi:hypothetical protein